MEEKKYTEMDLIELTNFLDNYVIHAIRELDRLLKFKYYEDWKSCFTVPEQRNIILAAYQLRIGLHKLDERYPVISEHIREAHRPTIERMEKCIRLNQANKKDELAF